MSEAQPELNETDVNNATANATAKFVATPEGMFLAYGSLFIMAIVPIFFGSLRSVVFQKKQKESGEKTDTMSSKDAAMFPVYASCALFGIYLIFKVFSKEYINMLLTAYFFGLGVLALTHVLSPIVRKMLGSVVPNEDYHLCLTRGSGDNKEEMLDVQFDRVDLAALAASSVIGVWYLAKKHWIANNMFGFAFSLNAIEMLQLNTITNGCILLGGLFVYDVFWVFGTDVMVTVAKSFEAPIKLVFPQDLIEAGLDAKHFAMLGLGDIVIPGILISLLLRYDVSLARGKRTYFYLGFLAYCLGLGTTIFVMHFFKHAQPALLYLVPSCLGIPIAGALVNGDISTMFKYADTPEEEGTDDSKTEKEVVIDSPAANTRSKTD